MEFPGEPPGLGDVQAAAEDRLSRPLPRLAFFRQAGKGHGQDRVRGPGHGPEFRCHCGGGMSFGHGDKTTIRLGAGQITMS